MKYVLLQRCAIAYGRTRADASAYGRSDVGQTFSIIQFMYLHKFYLQACEYKPVYMQ